MPRSRPTLALALSIVLLPLGYVLSFGPASNLRYRGYFEGAYNTIYAPLIRARRDSTPIVGPALNWYFSLWVDPAI